MLYKNNDVLYFQKTLQLEVYRLHRILINYVLLQEDDSYYKSRHLHPKIYENALWFQSENLCLTVFCFP